MKRKQIDVKTVLVMMLMVAAGIIAGVFCSRSLYADKAVRFPLLWMEAIMIVSAYVQILLHEAGHLVFGLLSGYRFLSFRVGSIMLQRDTDGLRFKRFTLAGTGGQCLMDPPEMRGDTLPYKLYNLGGALMNLFSCAAFAAIAIRSGGIARAFFLTLALFGALFALLNGVPMRLQIPNDGHNVRTLARNAQARRAFWLQLRINALQTRGTRLRDLPQEWFAQTQSGESMSAALQVLAANRLTDMQALPEAREAAQRLLTDDNVPALYKSLLRADLVFFDVLERGADADVTPLKAKGTKAVLRKMRDYPAVLRTAYAVALLHDADRHAADKVLHRLEKVAQRYPVAADVESERAWIRVIDDRYAK